MNPIVNYIVESALSLGVLVSLYLLVFRNIGDLRVKRFYLIFSLLFASVLPLVNLQFPWFNQPTEQVVKNPAYSVLSTITVVAGEWSNYAENEIPVEQKFQWVHALYALGLLLFLFRFILGLARLGMMKNLFTPEKLGPYRLFVTSGNYRPFSFFRLIFIPEALLENQSAEIILTHEKEHARQFHSVDIMLLELVLMVQWFNPFVWVVRREMKNNHEFMADRAVLQSGVKRADYLQSMMVQMMGTRFEMANNFSLSITQKRIKMMKLNKLRDYLTAKITITFFVAAILVLIFGGDITLAQNQEQKPENEEVSVLVTRKEEIKTPPPPTPPQNGTQKELPEDEMVFTVVEKMPEFPGGQDSMMLFLRKNVKYPREAHQNKIQGRVYVQFIIDKQGQVKNAKVLRSANPLLDAEALRVVNAMPAWKPGTQRGEKVNVQYNLPINFVLSSENKSKTKNVNKALFNIVLRDDEVSMSGDKQKYNLADGKEKVLERIEKDNIDQIFLNASNSIEDGQDFLDELGMKHKIKIESNSVAFASKKSTLKDANLFKSGVEKLIEASHLADDNLEVNLSMTEKGDSAVAFLGVEANSENLALNKKLESFTKAHDGNIQYIFVRTLAQK